MSDIGSMGAVTDGLGRLRGRRPMRPGMVRRTQVPRAPGGQVINFYPYYSAIRFQATVTGGATPGSSVIYTISSGQERRAFGYGIGDQLSNAGFVGTLAATSLETNLIQRAQTNAGENVLVHGLSAYLTSDSDPFLSAIVLERTSLSISLNGDQQFFRLGRATFLPGGGGLHGGGHSAILRPGMHDQTALFTSANNGLPGRENFYPLPYPIAWKSAGKADSNFVLVAKVERDISFQIASRAAADGVEAWMPPKEVGTPGTYVDLVFRLHTESAAPRSVNA